MPTTIFKRGDVCGGYQVLELMGCGGIAEVYKALSLSSHEIVALKVLRQCHAQNGYVRERMLAEAELLSKMSHANVVRVEDVGMDSELLWMAMEYLPGVTLRALLKASGPLAIPTALYYAREIADGVSAAHEMGVVHRDLKPENVIITEQHKVKVLDMGAAKFYGWKMTDTVKGSIFGTPLYMSPEHIRGEVIDARADVYSLGLILYEMIAGFHPFAKGSNGPLGKYEVCDRQLNVMPPSLEDVREGLPEDLCAFVKRTIAKDRGERPSTMTEFAHTVRAILKAVVAEGRVASLHDVPFGNGSGEEERGAGEVDTPTKSEGKEPAPAAESLGEGAEQGEQDDDEAATTHVFTRPDTTEPLSQQGNSEGPWGSLAGAAPPSPAIGEHGTEIMQTPWQSPSAPTRPRRERPGWRPPATGAPSHGMLVFAGAPPTLGVMGLATLAPRWLRWLLLVDGPPSEVLRRDCLVERALRTLLGALLTALVIALLYSWIAPDSRARRGEDPPLAVAMAMPNFGAVLDANGGGGAAKEVGGGPDQLDVEQGKVRKHLSPAIPSTREDPWDELLEDPYAPEDPYEKLAKPRDKPSKTSSPVPRRER